MESVLIVDDEKENLEALRRLLRGTFDITTTDSGIDALKQIQTREFAVIVSDQRMPEISGVDLLEKAKQIQPSMTRILLTGYTEVESVIGAINRGSIYRYIAKPWDPEDLKISLQQAAESFRLKKDLDLKNAALEKSNRELLLLDRAKARFLSLVSHELNTPLTSLTAFVALLGENAKAFPADVQRAVASLTSASDRFAEIVDEVLTYVRLEAETQTPFSSFDWEKELVGIIEGLERLREKKQVAIAVQGKSGSLSRVHASGVRVAVSKLIHEGISRSPKGERVTVLFKSEPGQTTLRVSWKGEPLPASSFQALEAPGEVMHHHRNLGLGLATAKLVADQHHGALTSEGAAGAASLVLTLPESP